MTHSEIGDAHRQDGTIRRIESKRAEDDDDDIVGYIKAQIQ